MWTACNKHTAHIAIPVMYTGLSEPQGHHAYMHSCTHVYDQTVSSQGDAEDVYWYGMIKFDLIVFATLLLQVLQCYNTYMHTFLTNYDFHRKCC